VVLKEGESKIEGPHLLKASMMHHNMAEGKTAERDRNLLYNQPAPANVNLLQLAIHEG
jgi:hypothetical protein